MFMYENSNHKEEFNEMIKAKEEMNKALFVLCIDSKAPVDSGNRMTDAALQCVHGGGFKSNSGNRWFDKTIQVCWTILLFLT